jgi:5-methylcytosine-specific restriction endonuclease McrA
MLTVTCLHCATPFTYTPTRGPRRKYCSALCSARAWEVARDKSKRARHQRTCIQCGTSWLAVEADARYCSKQCQDAVRYPVENRRKRISPRVRAARRKQARAARGTTGKGTVWTQGPCNRCGKQFISKTSAATPAKYCTKVCKERDVFDRRRERLVLAVLEGAEPVRRWRIFERDGYRCHICRRKTDKAKAVPHPRAPTIDHLIPIALGGRHEPANVACACFQCNSAKSHLLAGDQLALIG